MALGAGLGALGFWGFLAAVVVAGIWLAIRNKEAQHETLRRMIESGQPIDQALQDKLLSLSGGDHKRVDRDLILGGLITLFAAPGLAILGVLVGLENAEWLLPLLGVAALVGCIGIGLIVASRVIGRWYREDDPSAPNRTKA